MQKRFASIGMHSFFAKFVPKKQNFVTHWIEFSDEENVHKCQKIPKIPKNVHKIFFEKHLIHTKEKRLKPQSMIK